MLFDSNCILSGGLRNKGFKRHSIQTKPLISVITTVFNAASSLEATINSVLNQKYDNIEYIIIDGHSNDGSVDIIKKYQNSIDYWISEKDGGIYEAMNKGVHLATGDWIYFLGADDIFLNVAHKLPRFFTNKNTIYYGDVYMPGRHILHAGYFSVNKLLFKNICHQAIFYPRSVFGKYKYETKYKILADHALNLVCRGRYGFNFEYMKMAICIYNDETGTSANAEDATFDTEIKYIVKENFALHYYIWFRLRIGLYNAKIKTINLIKKIIF
jgi:glycosyltransferase involved in cell wall biosynthesis